MQHNFPNVKQIPILIVGNPSLLCQNITRQPQNGHPNSCSASHFFWMRHAVVNYTTTFCFVKCFFNMGLFLILEIVRISGIHILFLWGVTVGSSQDGSHPMNLGHSLGGNIEKRPSLPMQAALEIIVNVFKFPTHLRYFHSNSCDISK